MFADGCWLRDELLRRGVAGVSTSALEVENCVCERLLVGVEPIPLPDMVYLLIYVEGDTDPPCAIE